MSLEDAPVDEELKQLYSGKKHDACLIRCKAILAEDPLNIQALLYASEISLDRHELEDAIRYCDTILHDISEVIFIAWVTRGQALSLLERYDEAVASFTESLRYAPQKADTWSYMAVCMYMNGDKAKAFALLDMAEQEFGLKGKFELVRGYLERNDGNATDAFIHFVAGGLNTDPSDRDYEESKEIFAREARRTIDEGGGD